MVTRVFPNFGQLVWVNINVNVNVNIPLVLLVFVIPYVLVLKYFI